MRIGHCLIPAFLIRPSLFCKALIIQNCQEKFTIFQPIFINLNDCYDYNRFIGLLLCLWVIMGKLWEL